MKDQTQIDDPNATYLQSSPAIRARLDRLAGLLAPPRAEAAGILPGLLTLADAGRYLSCSRSAIYRLIKLGILRRIYPLPGSPRIPRQDLIDLASGKV
ncbi:MAG: helix-turn-helix domain-containing protein [Verrucomicrobia bacterium]|nr:helix-turn-helix domain-containing protein [Verrucomicrobiota bacterium]